VVLRLVLLLWGVFRGLGYYVGFLRVFGFLVLWELCFSGGFSGFCGILVVFGFL